MVEEILLAAIGDAGYKYAASLLKGGSNSALLLFLFLKMSINILII